MRGKLVARGEDSASSGVGVRPRAASGEESAERCQHLAAFRSMRLYHCTDDAGKDGTAYDTCSLRAVCTIEFSPDGTDNTIRVPTSAEYNGGPDHQTPPGRHRPPLATGLTESSTQDSATVTPSPSSSRDNQSVTEPRTVQLASRAPAGPGASRCMMPGADRRARGWFGDRP